jgi:hypothetical protein
MNEVGVVPHRAVGDVYDLVSGGGPSGQDGGDSRHGLGTPIDDAVEVD